jgi:hypothetical protein
MTRESDTRLLCRLLHGFSKTKVKAFRLYEDIEPDDLSAQDLERIFKKLLKFRRVKDPNIGRALNVVFRLKVRTEDY